MLIFDICFWTTRKDVADPKVAENKIFDAVGYGKCKIECYTKQSYIRQVLGHGKFKSIISRCDMLFIPEFAFALWSMSSKERAENFSGPFGTRSRKI